MRYSEALRDEIYLHVALLIVFLFLPYVVRPIFVKTIFTVIYKYLDSFVFLHPLFLFTDNIT